MRFTSTLILLLVAPVGCISDAELSSSPLSLIVSPDLAKAGAAKSFYRSSDEAWVITPSSPRGPTLELIDKGSYKPPHRSPSRIALLSNVAFGDFTLDVDALQTGREYGHRDLCIFFGFRDPAHYYYVHLASTPDEHACNIFLVDGAARRRIADIPKAGVNWGQEVWHHLRVERSGASIRVYFDDMGKALLGAEDETHGVGHIGVGSFDDTGRFANLRVVTSEKHGPVLAESPFRE